MSPFFTVFKADLFSSDTKKTEYNSTTKKTVRSHRINKPTNFSLPMQFFALFTFIGKNVATSNMKLNGTVGIWKCLKFNWCRMHLHLFACQFETDANILTIYLQYWREMKKKSKCFDWYSIATYRLKCITHTFIVRNLKCLQRIARDSVFMTRHCHQSSSHPLACCWRVCMLFASDMIVFANTEISPLKITCLHIRTSANKMFIDYVR